MGNRPLDVQKESETSEVMADNLAKLELPKAEDSDQAIDESLETKIKVDLEPNWHEMIESFELMNLKPELLLGLRELGYDEPKELGKLAIKPICEGRDAIVQTNNGVGKTGAFFTPILQRIDVNREGVQALIITDIRENAVKFHEKLDKVGKFMKGLKTVHCIGGTPLEEERQKFKKGPHVVVGTTGRLLDVIRRRIFDTSHLKMLVINHATKMLGKNFDHVTQLIDKLPREIQTVMFGRVYPEAVLGKAFLITLDPVRILAKDVSDVVSCDGIKMFYLKVADEEDKIDVLIQLYRMGIKKAVVLVSNGRDALKRIVETFHSVNLPISHLHGGMKQDERDVILERFHMGYTKMLVTTDRLAEGINLECIRVMIIFNLPPLLFYRHRVMRLAAHSENGIIINFITDKDEDHWNEIEAAYKNQVKEMPGDIDCYF